MSKRIAARLNLDALAEEVHTLIAATADVAGDKVDEARKRVIAALEKGRKFYDDLRDKAVEGTKAADTVVRDNPYQAIGIGVGIGALVGVLIANRCMCKRA